MKNSHQINNLQDLIDHINKSNITDDYKKYDLAIKLFKEKPDIIKNSEDLSEFINQLKIKNDYNFTQYLAIFFITN